MAKQASAYFKISAVSAIYMILCFFAFYDIAIPYKIAFPAISLFISALWISPWQIATAIILFASGDIMRAQGNFQLQTGAYGIAAIFFSWFFITRFFKMNGKASVGNIILTTLLVIGICALELFIIIPQVPEGTLRHGAVAYAIITSVLLWCALLQKDLVYALTGLAFTFSSIMLAWNKYISDVPYAVYLTYIPYYISILISFIRSSKI